MANAKGTPLTMRSSFSTPFEPPPPQLLQSSTGTTVNGGLTTPPPRPSVRVARSAIVLSLLESLSLMRPVDSQVTISPEANDAIPGTGVSPLPNTFLRSEEHTSELQSH